MNITQQNRSFFKYLNLFYYLSKLDNEYDINTSNAIVKKCVLIEKKIFFASKSSNLVLEIAIGSPIATRNFLKIKN